MTRPEERKLSVDELRQRQLELLRSLVDHCRVHALNYYLCAGTLLGAVRHQGYIPWDDDIDVMMPRADFERLCESFVTDAAMGLRAPGRTAGYDLPFAKLCDERTRLRVESDVIADIGVYVDIFPVDSWCRGQLRQALQRQSLRALRSAMLVKHLSLQRRRTGPRNVALRLAKVALGWVSTAAIARALGRTAQWGSAEGAERAGVIVWGYQEAVPAAAYGTPSTVTFEGLTLNAPQDPDVVLRTIYGDYMTLPPAEKQVTLHRFEAFSRD